MGWSHEKHHKTSGKVDFSHSRSTEVAPWEFHRGDARWARGGCFVLPGQRPELLRRHGWQQG